MSHHELDSRHLLCPMPVIKTQNKINDLSAGDTLDVFCTDPGALNDIPVWARINGHEILGTDEGGDAIVITVRVGA